MPETWLLTAMTGLGPFAMQILIPSLPAIALQAGGSAATAQLTLTLYLVGVACGQLLYGPLSDRFGRRPVLLGGILLFLAASLAAAFAPSIGALVASRIAQGAGGCVGMVLGRAIVRDVYPRDRAASVMGYVFTGMTVAPMLAPLLGAVLDAQFGWRASLFACLLFGAPLFLLVAFRLPETLPAPQPLPGLLGLLRLYRQLAAAREFRCFASITACSTGVFFAFMAGAPFVVVKGMGHPAHVYALAFMGMSVLFAAGSFAAGRLSVRLGIQRMLDIGLGITTFGAVAAVLAQLLLPANIWLFFIPMSAVAFGNGMAQPNAIAAAVSIRPALAGTASGLIGAYQMTVGALMTVIVGFTEYGAGIGTAIAMAAGAIGAQLALRGARS